MQYINVTDKKRIKAIIAETFANDTNQREYFISESYEDGVEDTYLQNITVIDGNNARFVELFDEKNGKLEALVIIL